MATMLSEAFQACSRHDGQVVELVVTVSQPEPFNGGQDWSCAVDLAPLWEWPTTIVGAGPFQAVQLGISHADVLFRILARDWIIRDGDGAERSILVATESDSAA